MKTYDDILAYLLEDWRSHPYRLVLEMFNWLLNICTGLFIAFTVPNTPFIYVYPIWFIALSINIFSAITRGSTGWLLTSISMFAIDIFGFIRLLLK